MKFEYDFKELSDFADKLRDLAQFEKAMEKATKEIAKVLLRWMKSFTPVEEYTLINGWNGNKFLVTKKDNGFEVLIVNTTPYALDVNDGHKAYNQYGGPYPIHNKVTRGPYGKLQGRVQVRSPHKWQRGDATYYVFGHFFVERGILRLCETKEIEEIIMDQLNKWWRSL
jgi:hypothetical protein